MVVAIIAVTVIVHYLLLYHFEVVLQYFSIINNTLQRGSVMCYSSDSCKLVYSSSYSIVIVIVVVGRIYFFGRSLFLRSCLCTSYERLNTPAHLVAVGGRGETKATHQEEQDDECCAVAAWGGVVGRVCLYHHHSQHHAAHPPPPRPRRPRPPNQLFWRTLLHFHFFSHMPM